jgi:RNA polymerase sigma-70 factor (ECF subfamily)
MSPELHQRFVDLLKAHPRIVPKIARMYCWDPDERTDLAQEITLQLWRAFPGYDDRRPFPTWMYRIALNVAISFGRKAGLRSRHAAPLDQEALDLIPAQDETDSEPLLAALDAFVAQLDALNRALLVLYLEDYSYKDMAEVLGISETNVATKISRLKQRIRADLTREHTQRQEHAHGTR